MRKRAFVFLALTLSSATIASAELQDQQQIAQTNVDRLTSLLTCAASKEPEYSLLDVDLSRPAAGRLTAQLVTPRVIRAMIYTGPVPSIDGDNWDLIFEFTDTEIYLKDQSQKIDPQTFISSPNPLPKLSGAPELTERVKDAFVACGVTWLGNWEYQPAPVASGSEFESLVPPD